MSTLVRIGRMIRTLAQASARFAAPAARVGIAAMVLWGMLGAVTHVHSDAKTHDDTCVVCAHSHSAAEVLVVVAQTAPIAQVERVELELVSRLSDAFIATASVPRAPPLS